MPECRGSEFNKVRFSFFPYPFHGGKPLSPSFHLRATTVGNPELFSAQARVLHHAVERMRLLVTQVDLLSKENARLTRQNEQLWEELRSNQWKVNPGPTNVPSPTSPPSVASVTTAAHMQQAAAAVAAHQLQSAHLVPFLLPPNFSGGVYSPGAFPTTAPSSPQPSYPSASNLPRLDTVNLSHKSDSETSSTGLVSPPSGLANPLSMDANLTRNLLLSSPFSASLLPNLANAAALTALSQADMQGRAHSSLSIGQTASSLAGMGPIGLLPSINTMGHLNEILLANMSAPMIDPTK